MDYGTATVVTFAVSLVSGTVPVDSCAVSLDSCTSTMLSWPVTVVSCCNFVVIGCLVGGFVSKRSDKVGDR